MLVVVRCPSGAGKWEAVRGCREGLGRVPRQGF